MRPYVTGCFSGRPVISEIDLTMESIWPNALSLVAARRCAETTQNSTKPARHTRERLRIIYKGAISRLLVSGLLLVMMQGLGSRWETVRLMPGKFGGMRG